MKPEFEVSLTISFGHIETVEADTAEEAMAEAIELAAAQYEVEPEHVTVDEVYQNS